jgi:hypothetical protein
LTDYETVSRGLDDLSRDRVKVVYVEHPSYVDLLFYHMRLLLLDRAKTGEFQPEYAGKAILLRIPDALHQLLTLIDIYFVESFVGLELEPQSAHHGQEVGVFLVRRRMERFH